MNVVAIRAGAPKENGSSKNAAGDQQPTNVCAQREGSKAHVRLGSFGPAGISQLWQWPVRGRIRWDEHPASSPSNVLEANPGTGAADRGAAPSTRAKIDRAVGERIRTRILARVN